jgi:hypothetical protein
MKINFTFLVVTHGSTGNISMIYIVSILLPIHGLKLILKHHHQLELIILSHFVKVLALFLVVQMDKGDLMIYMN